jgi:hypothetical protein
MVEELTGLLSASRILSTFVRNNYFIEKTFLDDEPVYQYNPLFREFMLDPVMPLSSL